MTKEFNFNRKNNTEPNINLLFKLKVSSAVLKIFWNISKIIILKNPKTI